MSGVTRAGPSAKAEAPGRQKNLISKLSSVSNKVAILYLTKKLKSTGPDINNGDNDLKRKQHPDHGRKKTPSTVHPCRGTCSLRESLDLLGVGCVSLEPEKDHPTP